MSARPSPDLSGAIHRSGTVKASNTIRKGFPVKIDSFDASGHPIFVEAAAIGDNSIGLSTDLALAGKECRVALWGKGIALGLVGTGGATAGGPLKWVADGLTNATVGGGTVKLTVNGQALETGVAADLIAVNLAGFSFTVGS
jgi:hypothetical protein